MAEDESVAKRKSGSSYRPSPDVMFREVGGEAVLLDLHRGHYFGLDEVGSVIWRLIGGHAAPEEMVHQLRSEYDVDEDTLRRDVAELLSELVEAGLIVDTCQESGPSDGGAG